MHEITTTWNYGLVALSVMTAIIGSYVALYLAERLRTTEGTERFTLTVLGASVMGLAIWSMHFVGMLAMSMRMQMSYNPLLSFLSMIAAALGAGVTFIILQRPAIHRFHYIFGSIAMGLAISTMHYTGMASMQMSAKIVYNPFLFMMSILVAISASAGALWLAFRPVLGSTRSILIQKIGSSVVMGIAISGMHYTGMAAAHYIHLGKPTGHFIRQTVGHFYLGDMLIIALVIFGLALIVLSAQVFVEKQKVIEELQSSERRFLATFEQAAVGIAQVSLEGKWIRLNKKYCDILGYCHEDLIGKTFQELSHPNGLKRDMNLYKRLIEGQINDYSLEKQYLCKDGNKIWVNLAVSIVRDENQKPLYSIAVAEDITQRKQAEKTLQEHQAVLKEYTLRLEQSNRDLEQFATITSHDLQAPLRKVLMFSESLKESAAHKLDENDLDSLERIQKATQHMQELIDDLLVLSRVTRKGSPFQPTNLNEVIDSSLESLEAVIEESKGEVSILNTLPVIDADERQLQQVFSNLIGNALKFHKPDVTPIVQISSEIYGGLCHITVKDNGIGFSQEYAERIFKIFERLQDSSKYTGTGIGLAIVQKIVERHHGHSSATSEPGQGATFTISLPVRQTMVADHEAQTIPPQL
jgi:PAS domain S-box-containing protein